MALRRIGPALIILLLFPLVAPASVGTSSTAPRRFRLIAYDYKQRLSDTGSYELYRANLQHQIGAAAKSFLTNPPTLAFLPEDTGLMAWFIGARGEAGRRSADDARSSTAAIAALAPAYAPQVAYYLSKCPGIPPARALVLALTDTAWRAFGEGLTAISSRYHIWVMANLNAPDISVTRDPAKVSMLADPTQSASGYAYEGGCDAWNTAFLFRPDAKLSLGGAADPVKILAGRQKKVYLVPIERTQDVGLALSSESPANARIIVTPFGRFGVLTSKDAWMPDVVERLEVDGMDVFLQPEAGAWAGHDESGLPNWPPDNMTRAVWSMVQWQAETSAGALADLTGNFGDLYFDGTATIVRDARPKQSGAYLLGRLPQAGTVARAAWVFPDPPVRVPLGNLAARRKILDAGGAKLVPGSGDPRENGQLANFVVADITLPPLGPVAARLPSGPRSVAVAPGPGAQWAPSLAVRRGGIIHAAWTDLRAGFESPMTARFSNGTAWSAPVKAGDSSARPFDQQDNQYDAKLAASPDGSLHLVWVDFRNQSWDVYASTSTDGGSAWSRSVRIDHSKTSGEGFPTENLDQDPTTAAFPDGTLAVAWSDARARGVHRDLMVARSVDGGGTWEGDARADGSGALAADQWSPAMGVARDGTLAVAWQDQRSGHNQILLSLSRDEGKSFSRPMAVAPAASDQWQPALAFSRNGTLGVAWSEGVGGGARRIRVAFLRGGKVLRLLSADPRAPSGVRQARPALTFVGNSLRVAWQDDRGGDWDILVASFSSGGARVFRADDGPPGAQARLPAVGVTGDGLLVAWEDTRAGISQIRTAAVP